MVDQSSRERITIRTVIKPELMRFTLKRCWIAAVGAVMIVLGGTILPLPYLKIWGIPLFFSGLILIAIGWLPYRKLQRLSLNPHSLEYDGEYFFFLKSGKPLFKIPEKSIAKLEYVEQDRMYGIAIWLKKPVKEKVHILQTRFNFETVRFQESDLFLPYFTERSAQELKI